MAAVKTGYLASDIYCDFDQILAVNLWNILAASRITTGPPPKPDCTGGPPNSPQEFPPFFAEDYSIIDRVSLAVVRQALYFFFFPIKKCLPGSLAQK